LTAVFSYVFVYNIVLAVFNLLPAFPMDGGRILRAVMAMRLPYVRATSIAVNIGRALAVFLGLYGLVSGGFFLMLIAFFVYTGATQEGRMVQTRGLLRGYTVQQAYSQRVGLLNPYDTIQRAVAMKLSGIQSSFPVSEYGNYVGFLTDAKLMQTLQMSGTHIPVHAVMSRDVQPVSLNSDLFDVQRRMQSEGLTALPVVEAGRVIGMITLRHIRELARMVTIRPDVISRVQSV
jgi:predicted transcriptional regulator